MTDRNKKLLAGLRIIDLTDQKGNACTKLLADLGARVIKIECPDGGDAARHSPPFTAHNASPENSLSFYYNNTGKLSITLDIRHVRGQQILLDLIKQNDVIVESFSPGYLEGLKLGFEHLRYSNPNVILTSITGFGQTGTRRSYQTCDLVAEAFGGQMSVTGNASPLKHYGEQSYLTASLFAAIGILLAVRKRRMTGRGDHIDISLQEAVASTLEHVMVRFFYDNIVAARQGPLHWDHLFHTLPCKDGFIQITLFDKWETLVEWMDSEGMARDLTEKKYLDETVRRGHLNHIISVLEKWTRTHSKKELFDLGQLMNFPWAPVHSPREVVESPQLIERDFFQKTASPQTEKSLIKKCPRRPFILHPSGPYPIEPPPWPGRDNHSIYHQELGIPLEELMDLSNLGII